MSDKRLHVIANSAEAAAYWAIHNGWPSHQVRRFNRVEQVMGMPRHQTAVHLLDFSDADCREAAHHLRARAWDIYESIGLERINALAFFEYDEEDCPGHVAWERNPKVCGRCGVHIDSLRPER